MTDVFTISDCDRWLTLVGDGENVLQKANLATLAVCGLIRAPVTM
jgi:hypothetical protein